jgi:hypothetical protein
MKRRCNWSCREELGAFTFLLWQPNQSLLFGAGRTYRKWSYCKWKEREGRTWWEVANVSVDVWRWKWRRRRLGWVVQRCIWIEMMHGIGCVRVLGLVLQNPK